MSHEKSLPRVGPCDCDETLGFDHVAGTIGCRRCGAWWYMDKATRRISEAVLETVTGTFHMCSACLDGAGGECHTPGCVMWLNRAPDLSIRESLRLHGAIAHRPPKPPEREM